MNLLDEIEVIVLDLDDTLYLERDYVRSGFSAVGQQSRQLGLGDIGDDLWRLFESGVRNNAFDEALVGRGIAPDPALIKELVATYRSHFPDISLLDDARRFLDRIGTMPSGLITDGPRESQRAKISALELDTELDWCVVTAELGPGRSKPHPAAFEKIEKAAEQTGRACVYIADNPTKDFEAPHNMGWRTVRVRREESLHANLESPAWVDLEIRSLDEL